MNIEDALLALYRNCHENMTNNDWRKVIDSFDRTLKAIKPRVPEKVYKIYVSIAVDYIDLLDVQLTAQGAGEVVRSA